MSTIRSLYGMNAVKVFDGSRVYKGQVTTEEVKSTTVVGIEVEVENARYKGNPSDAWRSEADGSLRNQGIEFVTKPMEARYAPLALTELLNNVLSEDCCFSPRTSIHVHVNMQERETEEVRETVLLYSLFEKLFFKFAGRGRIKNIYCVPLIDTSVLAGFKTKEFNEARGSWSKYSALNMLPISEYGTIEFRHMHGTFDAKKVSIWVRLLTKLCDYRKEIDWKKVGPLFDFNKLLDDVFGEDSQYLKYQSYEDVKQSCGRIRTAHSSYSNTHALMKLRDPKSPYYVGVV